jgi:hypothetical protein
MSRGRSNTLNDLERVMGIEPTLAAWEAAVLPLNYTRMSLILGPQRTEHQWRLALG